MKADSALITWLLEESNVSRYRISEDTGIKEMTLSRLANGISKMENITFETAATLTEYAIKLQDERRGLNTLWYNDNGVYHKIFEIVSDRTMSVDQILEFSDKDMDSIARQLGFDSADYENLTTEIKP